MNTVADLGEFGLIKRLAGILANPERDDLVVGIGDDAAVWRNGEEFVVVTTDTLVEGVHFLPGRVSWHSIGWKAMAVNISDISAMGGWPRVALVTLAMPGDTNVHSLDEMYAGLRDSAMLSATYVMGGDTVRADKLSIGVTVLGRCEMAEDSREPLILRRDAARTGDAIAVTGPLGESAAGLRRLQEGAESKDHLVLRHMHPRPALAEAKVAVQLGLRCAIDISDGLLQDVGHVCAASKVGAMIRASAIPISPETRDAYPDDALQLAATGGEDYELVLVGDEQLIRQTAKELSTSEITIIGEIVDDKQHRVRLLDDAGREIAFDRLGWDAFR